MNSQYYRTSEDVLKVGSPTGNTQLLTFVSDRIDFPLDP